jgi:putative transposase/transposase-like zinc-binding protein
MKNAAKPKFEVADIVRRYGHEYQQNNALSYEQSKVLRHIRACRTAELGGHVERCDHCEFEKIAYNSCRDRHCPKCQTLVKERWLNDRKSELLPCGYFHLVFTLPHDLNPIIGCNKKVALSILFSAASQTLQAFAKDTQWRLEGQIGFILVLHTWSQTLIDHYHLHCLIPGGALSFDKSRWKNAGKSFLFRVQSLSKAFKNRYLKLLETARYKNNLIFPGKTKVLESPKRFKKLVKSLAKTKWIVYAKRPFAGPEQVLEYLGRYTHRVAISNNRIQSIGNGNVTFTYKDRKQDNQIKLMTLSAQEFIRRFLLHVLPKGFMKIRYFGFLAHINKRQAIPLIRRLIGPDEKLPEKVDETVFEMMLRLTGQDITCCPECKKGKMIIIKRLPPSYCDSS